ncbi:hypothetical protein GGTG_09296 [Gaeumannomyces tritici R3-111a-1]|uniref:Uncharacterized protein n=1 Tax=Gaeumannomyces tritici (strain R3-111a-1) TaxID=644352 RepID=J3P6Z9_GAET3|nr:hypothetical protein GGTG_09296 [Gaeumannomyces tritici R3-111a-1]EJT72430.1 hypothetical protein GGTG_09296 [Gaeumannomyces tritici R3-111a-1]
MPQPQAVVPIPHDTPLHVKEAILLLATENAMRCGGMVKRLNEFIEQETLIEQHCKDTDNLLSRTFDEARNLHFYSLKRLIRPTSGVHWALVPVLDSFNSTVIFAWPPGDDRSQKVAEFCKWQMAFVSHHPDNTQSYLELLGQLSSRISDELAVLRVLAMRLEILRINFLGCSKVADTFLQGGDMPPCDAPDLLAWLYLNVIHQTRD